MLRVTLHTQHNKYRARNFAVGACKKESIYTSPYPFHKDRAHCGPCHSEPRPSPLLDHSAM